LGEFPPNGRLFTLSSFLKITEVAHICVLHFPFAYSTYRLCVNLTKRVLGYILGAFYETNLVTQLKSLKTHFYVIFDPD
jgi:hypothetical protein